MAIPIMAHLVLGYPTLSESIRTAEAYIAAGVAILELQIPFSHPTADGPVITAACQRAVNDQRVSVTGCLAALRMLREKYPEQELMVMSYLNRIYAFGLKKFGLEMKALGIRRLIIPDLPVDAPPMPERWPDYLVPVLAANISDDRLDRLLLRGFDFYYLMSDFKVTGSTFSLHPRLGQMIRRIRAANPAARAGIGFGIETPEQVRAVLAVADYAIIGSALLRAQMAGKLPQYLDQLKNAVHPATPTP